MSLLDEVRAYAVPRSRCSVPVVSATLSKEDAADLAAAIADPSITGSAIEKALQRRGVRLPAPSILRHRRKDCQCPA